MRLIASHLSECSCRHCIVISGQYCLASLSDEKRYSTYKMKACLMLFSPVQFGVLAHAARGGVTRASDPATRVASAASASFMASYGIESV